MKRHELIAFRVSPDERLAINTLAIKERRNTSEFLRELVRSELKRNGMMIDQATNAFVKAVTDEHKS